MRKQALFNEPEIPALVKDEALIVPTGETRYTIDLDDAQVEQMAAGLCPADVARKCWEMLEWKREHYRNQAREIA